MKTYPYFTSSYYIRGFFGENRFLSNYHVAPIKVLDIRTGRGVERIFPSVENYYQWRKLILAKADPQTLDLCQNGTPKEAKALGKSISLGDNLSVWDALKVATMEQALEFKFAQHQDLYSKLLSTSGKYLEESNNWSDKFWGVSYVSSDDGEKSNYHDCWNKVGGRNILGHLLMKLRETYIVRQRGL